MYGLFMLIIFTSARAQMDRSDFMSRVDLMMDQFYFEDADSAFYHLNNLYSIATDKGWNREALYTLINKAYVAEHHFMIDSLNRFLHKADSLCLHYGNNPGDLDPDNNLISEVFYMKGMYYYYQGDFLNAQVNFKKTIFDKNILQVADSLQTFNGLLNISQLAIFNSDYEKAMQFANMAERVLPLSYPSYSSVRDYNYQRSFIEAVKSKIWFLQNQSYKDSEIYEGIKVSLNRSLERIKSKENEAGTHNLFLKLYTQLADLYVVLKDYDSSLLFINKGMALSRGADAEQQIKFLYEAAHVHVQKNEYSTALGLIKEGQDIALKNFEPKNRLVARGHYEAGKAFSAKGDWNEALYSYQKSLFHLTETFPDYADIYALPPLHNHTLESEVLKVLLLKAQALYAWYIHEPHNQKNLFAAIDTYVLAVELIDKIGKSFQDGDSRQFLSSVTLTSYEKAIQAATQAYQLTSDMQHFEKAFYFAEKSKANQLVQAVKDISSKDFAGIPRDILEYENQLKGRIYYWKHALLDSEEADFKIRAQKNLLESQERYTKFIQDLEKEYPEYYQIKYKSNTISIRDVRNELAEDEVLIEYFYGDEKLYAYAISHNRVALKVISIDQQLHSKLITFLNLLKAPATTNSDMELYKNKSEELYSILIEPIEEVLPPEEGRLFVVTDGLLGYLPFEVLIEPNIAEGSMNFIINKFSVSYDYSATLRNEKKNIVNKKNTRHYVGFSPSYDADTSLLSNLKFNQLEVKQANEYMGGEIFSGRLATEENFYKNSPQASVLHLSLHANVDDKNPSASALYFYNATQSGQPEEIETEDNILYLYELYNTSLNARLTVLSACETGTGLYARGEGIMSLGRAFQYSGCPSVAMSLWKVNDKSTARIMDEFFHNLKKGMNKSEALRRAKLTFLNDPKNKYFSHPYYWSAFVLMGDAQPIVSRSWFTEIVIGLSLLVGLIALAFVKKRRRKTS
ncbi:CHAT domain-containing protein [Fulvivirga ulvae]|uniref:CHAT domain-containing protein n=1 Tax=Fulvivirga ulvae TaxID=2904245 RepID=UPI001F491728|nr:CHAT domain-containing protein [Fulvivirga ulvae]UII33406.1 CHAT domain-containing protein [Fulvivirga ulvae]